MSVRHPTLWVFVARLKSEERRIAKTIGDVRRGLDRDTRRRKWRDLEDRIVQLKNRYATGAINVDEYWNAIGYAVQSE